MIKLLRANFFELFRLKFFYLIMLACAVAGFFFTIIIYCNPQFNMPPGADLTIDTSNVLGLAPSFATIVIPLANAAIVALLMESQYNQGAIRNKLISGHTRTEVYLSGLLTAFVPAIINFVLFELFSMSTAVLAFDYENYDLKASFASLSTMLLMLLGTSTVLSFVIGNILRGGKMIVTIIAVQYVLTFTMLLGMYSNDSPIIDIIMRTFPQSFMFGFNYSIIPEDIHLNIIISLIVITVLTVFGVTNFKKCDIK